MKLCGQYCYKLNQNAASKHILLAQILLLKYLNQAASAKDNLKVRDAHESMKNNVELTVLGQDKKTTVHEASLYLLEHVGMKVMGEKVLKLLTDNGCWLKSDGLVCFPRNLIEHALKVSPKEIVLYNLSGEPTMRLDSSRKQYYGTHADQLEILDPFSGVYRKFLRADTKFMCQLANSLPNINFILSVGMSADIHPDIQSQVTFIDSVKYSNCTINFSTNDVSGLKDIISIASTIVGGSQKLQKKPFLFYYCEPIPPLTHPESSTEKLYLAADNMIPLVYMPYCMMGGTAVMSLSGTLAQCNAEVLAGLVMTQVIKEGAPFIYGAMPSIFDMKTTIGSYGAPEFHLMIKASSEMAAFYNLPFYGTAGCTDARQFDEQAVAELSMELFSTVLSGANLVHDIGVMDHCNSVSPEMVVFADELISGFKAYARGINMDDMDEALGIIRKVGPGSHFLEEEHTLNNFRNIWYPNLLSRKMNNKPVSEIRSKIGQILSEVRKSELEIPGREALLGELEQINNSLLKRVNAYRT